MNQDNVINKFAIVIPAYNEEATIAEIVRRALTQSDKVIVVDDGSKDKTITELDGLPVTLIKHESNQGKAASLWDGFTKAQSMGVDAIITLDGDGQHAPEDILKLLAKAEKFPNDIIIGARLADKSDIPAKRYYANKIANFWIAWAAAYPIQDSQSGFRLYPLQLFSDLNISTKHGFVFESEILIKAAQKNIYSHPVKIPAVYKKNARPSHFRGVADITLITLMVGKSLFSRGMYPKGLYRSFINPINVEKIAVKS
ncbi:MAG: glycosyltransferase family 2 protein [Woeseiaceae bacterium]